MKLLKSQFEVSHTNTSIFNIQFSKLFLNMLSLLLMKDFFYRKKLARFSEP